MARRTPARVIREMVGKVFDGTPSIITRAFSTMFKSRFENTVDYSRNDYDLWKSIYYASTIDKKGIEYQMAAPLAKPIINIMTGFVVGRGFTMEFDGSSENPDLLEAETEINDWLTDNMADLYDYVKFGYRDGDSYMMMDEMGEISLVNAKGVTVMLDPVSSKVIGFDVQSRVTIVDDQGSETEWIYLKQYRLDSTKIVRWKAKGGQQANAELVFMQVFTADNGAVLAQPTDTFDPSNLVNRRLPIKHFSNEPESDAVYGNSELQNVLVLFKNYSGVLLQATKGNVYNSTPIPVLKGVTDPATLEADSADPNDRSADKGKKTEWDQDSILYLSGEHADAKFLQANSFMDDVSKLLEIYFYLFVQGSETPEFSFGTAVASSKASTDTQMPILVRKIERKQRQLTKILKDVIDTYIEKQQLLSNPTFMRLRKAKKLKVRINYPPVADEDKQLTLETVQWAVTTGIMSNKTALELVAGDKVKDVTQELKDAAKDAKAAAKAAAPSQQDRLIQELLKQKPADPNAPVDPNAPTPPTPAPTPEPNPTPAGGK